MSDLIKATVRCRREQGMFRAGRKWIAIKQEVELTQAQIDLLAADLASFDVWIDGKQLGGTAAEPSTKDPEFDEIVKANLDLQARLAELESSFRVAREESKTLRDENESLRKENGLLQAETKTLSDKTKSLETDLAETAKLLEAATSPKNGKAK